MHMLQSKNIHVLYVENMYLRILMILIYAHIVIWKMIIMVKNIQMMMGERILFHLMKKEDFGSLIIKIDL